MTPMRLLLGNEKSKLRAPSWLSIPDSEWVEQNGYFLEGIWRRFVQDGEWPDPTEVQRELRQEDPTRRVADALATMPWSLARREYVPPRIALTVFGLGCCAGGRELLRSYLSVAQLALARFDSPGLPDRLTREDVIAELSLSDSEADRLSSVLMADAPFLGSGYSERDGWSRQVDPRAEEFEGIEDVDSLLSHLATQRGLNPPPPSPPAVEQSDPTPPADQGQRGDHERYANSAVTAGVVAALAAAITLVGTLVSSASIFNLALLGLFLGLAIAFIYLRTARLLAVVIVVVLIAIGASIGAIVQSSPPDRLHGYFVATSDAAVVIPLIEPRVGAPEVRDDVLVVGDKVNVRCILQANDRNWAELEDGAFIDARVLRPEVGGGEAPLC